MMIPLPSGTTINSTQITHTSPARWLEWPHANAPKIYHDGLDVHFIGGSVLRLNNSDAEQLRSVLEALPM